MTEEMLRLLAAQRREREDLLLCIDRAWGICARQARQARRRLRRLEGVLALTTEEIKLQPDASAEEPRQGETQLEALSRRLAAAQQEIRQYETKLFACDRAILALKKENAELAALCAKARERGFIQEEEEDRGPFWPDGLGPAPSGERPLNVRFEKRVESAVSIRATVPDPHHRRIDPGSLNPFPVNLALPL